MRLIFVNRFYWPETPATGQLLTDLAEALAATEHDVTVITSRAHASTHPAHERRNGVAIRRVRATRSTGAGVTAKARDFLTFYVGAAWHLWRATRRGDTVVALTDPPLIGIAAWLIARARGARVVQWVHDIYPEVAMRLGGPPWLRVLIPVRNRSWRDASACITLGSEMAGHIAAAGVVPAKIAVIPNWAPAGLAPADGTAVAAFRRRWQLDRKLIVAYSGNLGRVHDFEPVLTLAGALRDEETIAFVFIGSGAQQDSLKTAVAQRSLPNVTFLPPQPRDELAAALGAGDVHLVTLREGCERVVFPSKIYGIAAVERPVLFIGPRDCELARTIRACQLGHTAERHEIPAMADYLRSRVFTCEGYAGQARAFATAHAAPVATRRWAELLDILQAC